MNYKKIINILFFASAFQFGVSVRADWFDSLGQWMRSSDNQKKSVLALATIGIGYFIYRCWKKQPMVKNNLRPVIQSHLSAGSRSWSVDIDSDHEPHFSRTDAQQSVEQSRTGADSGAGLGLPFPARSRE